MTDTNVRFWTFCKSQNTCHQSKQSYDSENNDCNSPEFLSPWDFFFDFLFTLLILFHKIIDTGF